MQHWQQLLRNAQHARAGLKGRCTFGQGSKWQLTLERRYLPWCC